LEFRRGERLAFRKPKKAKGRSIDYSTLKTTVHCQLVKNWAKYVVKGALAKDLVEIMLFVCLNRGG
jgi:hypothetical protein